MLARSTGCPRSGSSAACSSTRASTSGSRTARRSCSSRAATAASWAASAPRSTTSSTTTSSNDWGLFGFLEFEEDEEVLRALLDAAAGLAARARARPDGRPDGLHDAGRGRASCSRATTATRSSSSPGTRPTTSACARPAGSRRRWTSSCGSWYIADRSAVVPGIEELAEKLEPEHGIRIRQDEAPAGCARSSTCSPRPGTTPGRTTGASGPTPTPDLDTYAAGPAARLRQALVHGRREDRHRRERRRRHHRARHQPGAEEDERAPAALRLVALPAPRARSWTASGSDSSG